VKITHKNASQAYPKELRVQLVFAKSYFVYSHDFIHYLLFPRIIFWEPSRFEH